MWKPYRSPLVDSVNKSTRAKLKKDATQRRDGEIGRMNGGREGGGGGGGRGRD